MKHPILFIAFLLLPLLSFSQGVKFEQGSWKDALALAKQTNKPVLLNLYFSNENWNREVFSSETVGDVCNTYFVCYKMDASKTEGLELAKKYGLTKRPAVLFINADGSLLSRHGGALGGAAEFIEAAKKVLLDLRSPKPITAWEAEYPKKKKDSAFLLEYIDKRIDLRLPINEAFDAYLRLLPASDPIPIKAAQLFQLNRGGLMATEFPFQYFLANRKAYFETLVKIGGGRYSENYRDFQDIVDHTIDVATLYKDEALLKKAIAAFQQIPYDSDNKQVEELFMDYYQQIKQPDKYLAHARLFMAENLKKLDSEELLMKNNTMLKNYEERIASETDTAEISVLKRIMKGLPELARSQLCSKINTIAGYVLNTFSNSTILEEALLWSDKAVQACPTITFYLDTNAHILYKLGRKEEAVAMEKRAVANFQGSPTYTRFTDTLKKMEAGEKLW